MITGKTSINPLTRIASKYIEMQNDGRLLTNRMSIEVVRKRIADLSERIDLHQAPDRLANLQKLWTKYLEARGTLDETMTREAVEAEFEAAYHDYAAWKQMFEAIDLDRKLVESEVKVIKDMKATLTAEDATNLTAQLLASIISSTNSMEGVTDHIKLNFLKRIQYEFTRIVGFKFDGGTRGGGEEGGYTEASELDRTRILDPGDEE